MKDKKKIEKLEKKVVELKNILNQINNIIYAQGLKLGSDNYFKVRGLCVDTVRETDMRMIATWYEE